MANKLDVTKIKDNYNKFILKPMTTFGIAGLIFDVPKEETLKISADITNHYVEDNQAVQDHYALKPLEITLSNYIGELVYEKPDNSITNTVYKYSQVVAQKLITLSNYATDITTTAKKVKNLVKANNIDYEQSISTVSDLYSLVKDLNPSATKRQKTYLYLKSMMQQKILFSVDTPFEFLDNMIIKDLIVTIGEETNTITEFTVTLQQMRFAETIIEEVSKVASSKTSNQKEAVNNKGKVSGKTSSLLTSGIKALKGIYLGD